MGFAGVDYRAVVIAAIVGYAVGALWYWGWSKPWIEAQGFALESMKTNQSPVPYLLAFVANLIMAGMLAGVIGHLGIGEVTIRNGIISAAAVWLGFVATTQTVNYRFGRRPLKLLLIDGAIGWSYCCCKAQSSALWAWRNAPLRLPLQKRELEIGSSAGPVDLGSIHQSVTFDALWRLERAAHNGVRGNI